MAKQPKAQAAEITISNDGIETEAPLPVSQPTVTDVTNVTAVPQWQAGPDPQLVPQVVACADCIAWKMLNPRAAAGQCMLASKYASGPIYTTDMMTCSQAVAR